ncbi:WecB/TagA/CpsF family glycosyltransferase [Candidatus Pelagibacter sp.]|nr:WecB/TagA/CpsF family glycosyltransferase [Candidatus Pelagibacter sp.]
MKIVNFLDIKFLSINILFLKKVIKKKGLFVFPSGPGLSELKVNSNYHKSLINSDYVFFDSGFFVLLLRFFKNINVQKLSGYKFLDFYFDYLKINKKKIFSIDPNKELSNSYRLFFKKKIKIKSFHYIAPKYNLRIKINKNLIKRIHDSKAKEIIINIGGGTQEILGYYLSKKLNKKYKIVCTGAAIAFFTGDQSPINNNIDKLYLGWLFRIIYNPKIFLPRYLSAFKLFFLFIRKKNTISLH